MNADTFFHQHPIFRYEEFAEWKKTQGVDNKNAIHVALFYYIKTQRLLNIRRELYAVIPPGTIPNQFSVDPYLLCSKASIDSVLAYHTALELHGVAYSTFEQFYFLTSKKVKPFEFKNQLFQPVSNSLLLKRNKKQNYGIEKIDRQGVTLLVTNLARTFVDVLDRVELSGGWEEVVRSISNMVVLDIEAVIYYCLLLNNRVLAAKVGFFLEQREGAFKVNDKLLLSLLRKKPDTPQSLIIRKGEKGKLIKKWNIILPLYVLNKSWEEQDYDV